MLNQLLPGEYFKRHPLGHLSAEPSIPMLTAQTLLSTRVKIQWSPSPFHGLHCSSSSFRVLGYYVSHCSGTELPLLLWQLTPHTPACCFFRFRLLALSYLPRPGDPQLTLSPKPQQQQQQQKIWICTLHSNFQLGKWNKNFTYIHQQTICKFQWFRQHPSLYTKY